MEIKLPSSKPQAVVASSLDEFRRVYLQDALKAAVRTCDLHALDEELRLLVPPAELRELAAAGIRGELIFPVPLLLRLKPHLLGYYRLVLGYSQKEFYQKGRLARFQTLESRGLMPNRAEQELEALCRAMIQRASELIAEIGPARIDARLLQDLALLTLGPQLRGGANTKIGRIANRAVFEIIQQIVEPAVVQVAETRLKLVNAARRHVVIAFAADPDIAISEELAPGRSRNIVAIEIKGGTDRSNIWNRLGEAEKSHRTAKQKGFEQCWTIINVSNLDLEKARQKSPTTDRFFYLVQLASSASAEFADFRDRLCSAAGIEIRP